MCNFAFAQIDSNAIFESNKGKLPFPLKKSTFSNEFYKQMGRGSFQPKNTRLNTYLSFIRNKSEEVYAIFDGKIIMIEEIDTCNYIITTKFEDYYISYLGLTETKFKVGDIIKKDQLISSLAKSYNNYTLDLFISKSFTELNPKEWLLPIK